MPTPPRHAVAEALAAVLHEALREEGAAEVPGLGRFERLHRPARLVQRDGAGRSVLAPPRDIVRLAPEPDAEVRG